MLRRRTILGGLCSALAATNSTRASPDPIRIGVLTDMSDWGRDIGGPGAAYAVSQAIQDAGGRAAGRPVELRVGDHKMQPDLAVAIARQWFDEGVDAIADLENSEVGLAVSALAARRDRICLVSSGGSSEITNSHCNARTVAFTYDTYALAKVMTAALQRHGGLDWFFVGADYAFGHQLVADAGTFVAAGGGRVLGAAFHPPGAADYAPLLHQAEASGAQVIALANTGTDCTTALRQAHAQGIAARGPRIAALAMFDTDVAAAGLDATQGALMVTSAWGTMSPEARTWTQGYYMATGLMPTMLQLGDYGVVTHYLKAVEAAGTTDAALVMAKMRELPIQDLFCRAGTLRPDGRVMREMYLMRVKPPAQAKLPYDYLELVETVPAEDAYRPAKDSVCPLLRA